MPLGIVRVGASEKNPSHDIELWDGIRAFGLKLDGGPRGIQEIPQTPSTLKFSGGGTKFGDWEPGMSHIQQSDWSGGRGQEQFSEDDTRFLDSQNCWTLTPNRLMQGGQAIIGTGLIGGDGHLPNFSGLSNSVAWKSLLGSARYIATSITPAANRTADKCRIWIRRIGSPGTLTFELRTNSGGSPTTSVLKSTTATASTVDLVSLFNQFDWTSTQALTGGTMYHIVLYGAATDSIANHWEIGYLSGTLPATSADGTTWVAEGGSSTIFYHLTDADVDRKFIHFELDGQLYAVDNRVDGTASKLYQNGYRGKATSATSTALSDTNQSFDTSAITYNSYVRIINGKGIGQVRPVTTAASTAVDVLPAWDITPDSTSEYVIIGSNLWVEVGTTGLTKPVTSVCVTESLPGVAYMAQGNATNIRRMRFDATAGTPAHGFADDGTNKADLIYTFYNYDDQTTEVVRAINGTTVEISGATAQGWGTDLTFSTGKKVGNKQYKITNIIDYDGVRYILKEDRIFYNDPNGSKIRPLNVGLESAPDPMNGVAARSLGLFLFFSYMHSVQRLYGKTLDDENPTAGSFNAGRVGNIVSMSAAFNWLFCAIDARASGVSSVMCYDGRGWHEVFRSLESGSRIRSVHWQAIPDGRPRLWVGHGAGLVAIPFPQDTLNPLNDSGFPYHHEAVMVGSTIDMDSFNLPKFIKERTVVSQNLSLGTEIRTDYQTDSDIGTTTWTPLGNYYQSPVDVVTAGFGNIRQVRVRDRLITDSYNTPTIVKASVVEGYARTPLKYQYNMRIVTSSFQTTYLGGRDALPSDLTQFLKNAARSARKIIMRSRFPEFDNLVVIVEPPTILRDFQNSILQFWGGKMSVVVREA